MPHGRTRLCGAYPSRTRSPPASRVPPALARSRSNYAVSLGKSAFGFSLVGISGKDIQDGIVKLVLALT